MSPQSESEIVYQTVPACPVERTRLWLEGLDNDHPGRFFNRDEIPDRPTPPLLYQGKTVEEAAAQAKIDRAYQEERREYEDRICAIGREVREKHNTYRFYRAITLLVGVTALIAATIGVQKSQCQKTPPASACRLHHY